MKTLQLALSVFYLLVSSPNSYAQQLWEPLGGPIGIYGINEIVEDESGRLFLIKNKDIYTSIDKGTTWTKTLISPQINTGILRFIQSKQGNVYLVNYIDVFDIKVYDKMSNTWIIKVDFAITNIYAHLVSFNKNDELWVIDLGSSPHINYSTDQGKTFQNVTLNGTTGWVDNFSCYDDNNNLFVAGYGTSTYLYHFTKSGSLTQVKPVESPSFLRYNLFTGTAYMIDYYQVYRSTDGGFNWQVVNLPLGNTSKSFKSDIQILPDGKIILHCSKGVFLSDDDGISWANININSTGNFYCTSSFDFFKYNDCELEQLEILLNGSNDWKSLQDQFKFQNVTNVTRNSLGNIYTSICNDEYIQLSQDNGVSWTTFVIKDPLEHIVTNIITLNNGIEFALTQDLKLYKSSNNGVSWEHVVLTNTNITPFSRLYLGPNKSLYLISDTESAISKDLGNSWINIKFTSWYNTPVNISSNGDIYSTADSYEYKYLASKDSVFTIDISNQFPNSTITGLYCLKNGTVLYSIYDNSNFDHKFYRQPNGEGLFSQIVSPFEPSSMKFCQNVKGDIFGYNTNFDIYKSIDDGTSWSKIGQLPKLDYPNFINCLDDQHLYVGYSDDVLFRSNNPTASSKLIVGKSWVEINNDCTYQFGEFAPPPTIVKVKEISGEIGFTNHDGNFILTGEVGNYHLNVIPPNNLYTPCFTDVPVTIVSNGDTAFADLPLKIKESCPYLQVQLSTNILRRCFDNSYYVSVSNKGTAVANNVTLQVTLDPYFIFNSTSWPNYTNSGQVYTFQLGNIEANASVNIQIHFKVSCDATLGQEHCITAEIFPKSSCTNPLDDYSLATECKQNVGSFDPNEKHVFVNGVQDPAIVKPNETLEYQILFQNTGTDTAFRIIVEDVLPAELDIKTIEPLIASHPYVMEFVNARTVRFIFDNILLPDSNINEVKSHGFIKFRIKPFGNTVLGTQLNNAAHIYFDYNLPITTNTSSIQYTNSTSSHTLNPVFNILASPNPFHDVVNFQIESKSALPSNTIIQLYDVYGKLCASQLVTGKNTKLQTEGLLQGCYIYKITSEQEMIGSGVLIMK